MPDSSLDAFAKSLAKWYVKGRRVAVKGYRALRPLALATRPLTQKAYLAVFGSRKRKTWAGAVVLLLVLGIAGTSVGVSHAEERERVAAVAAKDAADAEAAAAQAKADAQYDYERLKDARHDAEDLIASASVFSKESADYAAPEEKGALTDAIVALRGLPRTAPTADLLRAIDEVNGLIVQIGPRPIPHDWPISCRITADASSSSFESFRAVWSNGNSFESCESEAMTGDFYTDVQLAAVASKAVATESDLGDLYAMCAEPNLGFIADSDTNDSDEAFRGALTICPDHPNVVVVKAKLTADDKAAAAERKARRDEAAGIIFGAGVRTVGKDLQPGVYVAVNVSNCYWERLDSSGEIHDNNFIMGAPRVEVTVRSSDYAFNSTGCGQWRRQ